MSLHRGRRIEVDATAYRYVVTPRAGELLLVVQAATGAGARLIVRLDVLREYRAGESCWELVEQLDRVTPGVVRRAIEAARRQGFDPSEHGTLELDDLALGVAGRIAATPSFQNETPLRLPRDGLALPADAEERFPCFEDVEQHTTVSPRSGAVHTFWVSPSAGTLTCTGYAARRPGGAEPPLAEGARYHELEQSFELIEWVRGGRVFIAAGDGGAPDVAVLDVYWQLPVDRYRAAHRLLASCAERTGWPPGPTP